MQPLSTLRRLLQQKLNIDSAALTPSTNLKKDLEMSEWEWDYLLNSIEQAWEISLPSTETKDVVNVKHLLTVVKKQQPNKFSKS
jgi:acyl carrier protein